MNKCRGGLTKVMQKQNTGAALGHSLVLGAVNADPRLDWDSCILPPVPTARLSKFVATERGF